MGRVLDLVGIAAITENFVIVTFFRSQLSRSRQELTSVAHESSYSEPNSNLSLEAEGTKLEAEGTKLEAEGTKLEAEGTKLFLKREQVKTIQECEHEKTAFELMDAVGRNNRSKFQETVLKPLIHAELIEMTIPEKPRSRNQKYRLTQKGKDLRYNL